MNWDQFKDVLTQTTSFPTDYRFKFIVPLDSLPTLEEKIHPHTPEFRPSKKGNYVSATVSIACESPDEVVNWYNKVSSIPGIISL